MRNKFFMVFICWIVSISVWALEPVTDENWQNHPEIKKIRILFNEINRLQKVGKLKKQRHECEFYDGSLYEGKELYQDKSGVVRKYVVGVGTGDSADNAEYYYDAKGLLRFTYLTTGRFDTLKSDRIYYDEKGEYLYTNTKQEGVGFLSNTLRESLLNPAGDFALPCE
jgi:hypothetical protein